MTEKHNGWTNYATWRINLELVDGIDDNHFDEPLEDIHALQEYIKDYVEEVIETNHNQEEKQHNLAIDYAMAFISNVNWYEIASKVVETYPSIIKNK